MMNSLFKTFAVTCLAGLAVACGGGGENSDGGGPGGGADPGPGGGTGGINGGGVQVSQGAATRLGSVYVNGVRYDVSAAQIFIDGAAATEAALKPGQVLRVVGDVEAGGGQGNASIVTFETSLRGRITGLAPGERTITVLGQVVRVGLETVFSPDFSPGELESLSVGEAVIVSGFRGADGELLASRIERDQSPGVAVVVGPVAALDPANDRFRINDLTVDYRSAVLSGFPGLNPVNGDIVMAEGPLPAPGAALVATTLSLRSPLIGGASEIVAVEGLVTRYAGPGDFDVAGQRVVTSASTVFVGTSAAALRAGDFVFVLGQRDAADGLTAGRVELLPPADIQVEARIDAVDPAAGTLALLGITVETTPRTRYVGDDDGIFSLADLRAGDAVEVAGYASAGRFVAVRIENDDDDGEVEIEGPVTDLADPEFRIGGIRIVTDSQTSFDDTSRAAFFASAAGRRVEVEGIWTGTFVLAQEVELED